MMIRRGEKRSGEEVEGGRRRLRKVLEMENGGE